MWSPKPVLEAITEVGCGAEKLSNRTGHIMRNCSTGVAAALVIAAMPLAPLFRCAVAQLKTDVVTVSVRPSTTMKYLEITAVERPKAVVVLMAGGRGVLGLRPSGEITTDLNLNFLMRTREQFAREACS